MKKYGSPIVVLNLMKKTEEKGRRDRRREGILSDEFRRQVTTILLRQTSLKHILINSGNHIKFLMIFNHNIFKG